VLHNLRSTLDHLAYSLAEKHTGNPLPDPIAQTSEFPIFSSDDSKAIDKKIRGIHPHARAIIIDLQPYQRGNDYSLDPLWILQQLSNIDKHRLLLIGTVNSVAAGFSVDKSRNYDLRTADVYAVPIRNEAIVCRYRAIPKNPNKEMHLEFNPLLEIAFESPLTVAGKNVIKTCVFRPKPATDSDASRPPVPTERGH